METLKKLIENSREANERLISLVEQKMKRNDDVTICLSSFKQVLKMIYESNCALSMFMVELDANKYKDLAYAIALKNRAIKEIINRYTVVTDDETRESLDIKMLDEYLTSIER